MSPREFRQNPLLRTCGYDLFGWALLNALLALPVVLELMGRRWSPPASGLMVVTAAGCGWFFMWVNRRRAVKLMGPLEPRSAPRFPVTGGAVVWTGSLAAGLMLDNLVLGGGWFYLLLPSWMVTVGLACTMLGRRLVPELSTFGTSASVLGCVLLVSLRFTGAAESAATAPIVQTLIAWNATMVVAAGIVAVTVNRRYAWSRGDRFDSASV